MIQKAKIKNKKIEDNGTHGFCWWCGCITNRKENDTMLIYWIQSQPLITASFCSMVKPMGGYIDPHNKKGDDGNL